MTDNIYQRDELITLLDIEEEQLNLWEKEGLLVSPGFMENEAPFYTLENVNLAKHIKQLSELGYDLSDIQKIVKKVGLPGSPKSRKEKQQLITIGELAELAGLNPRTIKYWEERGIIEPDCRSNGGFRLYSRRNIQVCQLIKDLQNFGYTLEEIKEASDLFRNFFSLLSGKKEMSDHDASCLLDVIKMRLGILEKRMAQIDDGIRRWETLIKKHRKGFKQLSGKYNSNSKKSKK